MSWVTPKTNWQSGDYYNIEDIERISGNLTYLKGVLSEIYPDSEILVLDYLGTIGSEVIDYIGIFNEGKICQPIDFSISDIEIRGVNDYLGGSYTITQNEVANIIALYKLKMLYYMYEQSNFSVPNISASQKLIVLGRDTYYSGCGYYGGDTYIQYLLPPYDICDPDTHDNELRICFSFYKYYGQPDEIYHAVDVNALPNKVFWSSSELSVIEKEILALYTKLSAL